MKMFSVGRPRTDWTVTPWRIFSLRGGFHILPRFSSPLGDFQSYFPSDKYFIVIKTNKCYKKVKLISLVKHQKNRKAFSRRTKTIKSRITGNIKIYFEKLLWFLFWIRRTYFGSGFRKNIFHFAHSDPDSGWTLQKVDPNCWWFL